MGKVTYIEFGGAVHEVEVQGGQSMMEGAVGALVPGIVADCGGACACAALNVRTPRAPIAMEWAR